MLDSQLAAQLQQYLGMLRRQLTLTATLGDDAKSAELHALLQQIAGMSEHITLTMSDNSSDAADVRKPSFTIGRPDSEQHLRFVALPLEHEFTSLVLALLWTGGPPPKVDAAIIERIQALPGPYHFDVFMSLSCQSCPEVVQALALMAIYNPRVHVTVVDGALFQPEVEERQIMAVPAVLLNGQHFANGRMGVEEILAKLTPDAAARQSAVRRAGDRRWACRFGCSHLRRAQGRSHRPAGRTHGWANPGYAVHRKPDRHTGNQWPTTRCRLAKQCAPKRCRRIERARRNRTEARCASRWTG